MDIKGKNLIRSTRHVNRAPKTSSNMKVFYQDQKNNYNEESTANRLLQSPERLELNRIREELSKETPMLEPKIMQKNTYIDSLEEVVLEIHKFDPDRGKDLLISLLSHNKTDLSRDKNRILNLIQKVYHPIKEESLLDF